MSTADVMHPGNIQFVRNGYLQEMKNLREYKRLTREAARMPLFRSVMLGALLIDSQPEYLMSTTLVKRAYTTFSSSIC